ncbi:MAG: hypothetical protein NDJ89_14740 [Oligoflexia bacterium]|nr:hypothetical protein [Oligoflexia bacterium]
MPQTQFAQRFQAYFAKEVAEKAASSLANGAEMGFQILGPEGTELECFCFRRQAGRNQVTEGASANPQLLFKMTEAAAEAILADPADEIGQIGVNIAKLILSPDATRRVSIHFKAGFFTLFTQGYLGVVTAGGGHFATYLASKGLSGMGAIKAALKKKAE